jgi:hypothetical protein
MRRKASRQM